MCRSAPSPAPITWGSRCSCGSGSTPSRSSRRGRSSVSRSCGPSPRPSIGTSTVRTAEELGVHRNTVRQRVTRFEAGRAGPIDRVELTLALCLHAAFG
ncbi:helix-turn-helix domain-containing protein [Microbacterium lacticum]